VLIAFGAFSQYAPWKLLHTLPVFSSQHVPSRWMMPALLLLVCAAASAGERFLAWTGRLRGVFEIGTMVAVAFLVRDICQVARTPLTHAFQVHPPTVVESTGEFRTVKHVPRELDYNPEGYASTTLTAAVTNIDSIDCATFSAYSTYLVRDKARAPGLGARAVGDAEYRGEAYVAEGRGAARILRFTPNQVDVRVDGARPGDKVVLNQNWDTGWSADGKDAASWQDAIAGFAPSSSATVRFRYWPRMLSFGLLVFVLSIAVLAAPWAFTASARFLPRDRRSGPLLPEPRHRRRRRDPPPP
jgi:hypothetical protein